MMAMGAVSKEDEGVTAQFWALCTAMELIGLICLIF
jgi:hypothetical protein